MPRILIVDDEPALLALLARTFVKAGFDVKTATDAARAMESCTAERFDAVLSDVDLPGMDGRGETVSSQSGGLTSVGSGLRLRSTRPNLHTGTVE